MAVAVVGGGPAVLGLVTAAYANGGGVGDDELVLVHAGGTGSFGPGRLGGYDVRSDTRARVFTECVAGMSVTAGTAAERLVQRCSTDEPVPLRVAGALLGHAGQSLLARLRADRRVTVVDHTRVVGLRAEDDEVTLELRSAGRTRSITVRSAVLGIGGAPRFPPEVAAGPGPRLHSDAVLRRSGRRALLEQLDRRSPRVMIVGGSHSAFAVARVLLRSRVAWAPGAIAIVHRSPILMTYADVAAARADGQMVRPRDVCPLTGLVHRFGGLRTDAAALYRRVRDGAEPRVRLELMDASPSGLADVTADGAPVVWATGYGSPVAGLLGSHDPTSVGWDDEGRLTRAGAVVPGVYGLGLGTARRRGPGTGGEPAFTGAIDGVWFYQQVVAPRLLELLRERGGRAAR